MKRPSIFDFSGLGKRPKMSKFDLSHETKLTCDMGDLVPFLCQEAIPGDSWRCSSEVFLRFQPLLAPVMHRIDVYTHFFFVPNRLIWNEWQEFITGGRLGTSNPSFPRFTMQKIADTPALQQHFAPGFLPDYLGFPTFDGGAINAAFLAFGFNLLPFKAYQLIWSEYYRDQNLAESIQDLFGGEIEFQKGGINTSGDQLLKLFTMRKRAWEKDYFTSALPFAQRGNPVSMPLDTTVTYADESYFLRADGTPMPNITLGTDADSKVADSGTLQPGRIQNIEGVESSFTINALRVFTQLQVWLEKNARGGARYVEQLFAHFGVHAGDYRLQRPEYLGGGKQPAVISEVLQTAPPTSADEGGTPAATMFGHGISVGSSNQFTYKCKEHGFIIGILSILPRTAYGQMLPKMWYRTDKLDYAWPEFANLGEQAVSNAEVFFKPDLAPPGGVTPFGLFGYQSRYSEYKYIQDSFHGEFRSTLQFWHLGRDFANIPALNIDFVQAVPRTNIFAVEEGGNHLLVQIFNRISAVRPLPYFGTPKLG